MVTSLPSIPPTFALGVCDYPEHVPWEQWRHYPERQRELGITYVRIAEFAWSQDRAARGRVRLDLARRRGAGPGRRRPAHRDVHADGDAPGVADPEAPGDPAGRGRASVRNFGSRKHYDHASPIYREHSRRITTEIAERYGQHPAVVGWQTDNEFGCHDTARSYGRASRDAFRVWLEAALRDARGAERGLGQCLLEPGVHRLGPDRPAAPDRGPAQPLARARLLPLRQRRDRRVPGGAGRDPAPALARRWVTHNFMMHFTRLRPLPGRGVPRLRLVGLLSPRSGRALPAGRGEGALGEDRPPRPHLVQPRSLPRSEGPARLLGDGAGGRPGELGALQLPAGGGSGRPLDRAGLRPRLRRRQLLPVAGGDRRPGADALRVCSATTRRSTGAERRSPPSS